MAKEQSSSTGEVGKGKTEPYFTQKDGSVFPAERKSVLGMVLTAIVPKCAADPAPATHCSHAKKKNT